MQILSMLKEPPAGVRAIEVGDSIFTWVDETDYVWLSRYKWRTLYTRYKAYVVRPVWRKGYIRWVRMHRVIMRPPQGFHVHHKNGNTLDNRRENLENMRAKDHAQLHGGF